MPAPPGWASGCEEVMSRTCSFTASVSEGYKGVVRNTHSEVLPSPSSHCDLSHGRDRLVPCSPVAIRIDHPFTSIISNLPGQFAL
jgi:hypothetical protein